MSDTERDKKIDELLEIVKRAPALNGGFAKMSDAISEIQESNLKVLYELQNVTNNSNINTKKIGELHSALYEPDVGLYRRVTTALEENEEQTEQIKEVTNRTDTLSEKVAVIETKNEALETVAGKDLKDLRSVIIGRKNFVKIFWAFAVGVVGGIVKLAWDVFS